MRARWIKRQMGLAAIVTASGLAWAAGAGMTAAPAVAAAATSAPSASRHHVSPFGLGAGRALRHATGRHAAAPRASTSTVAEWVSNAMPVGNNTGCASPGFTTISSALAAAPAGATVEVCAGTYPEQLAITQSVALVADGAVTVAGPASPADNLTSCDTDGGSQPNQDVVDICGPAAVTISGFTIEGNWPSGICNDSLYGVAVLGGADLNMSDSTVENIGGSAQTDGCQGGVGIEVGLALTGTTADPGTATLTNDLVETYQKNGITVDGAGSSATISGATVIGVGPTPAIAQNGIQVSDNATAAITGSFVSGDECDNAACGPDGYTQTQSTGILLFDAGKTTVSSTVVSTSDIGVYSIQDYTWKYYTPPSPFTAVNEAFSSLGLNNRYENAFFDEGKAKLTGSALTGGEVGLEVAQGSYQTTPAVVTATGDTIGNASTDAVLVATDGTAGDKRVQLKVTGDSLDTTNAGGIANQSTSVVGATGDWWGDPTGPSDWSFGTGSSVSADVNFFPWATDSALSTLETCQKGTSVTTNGNNVVLCAPAGTANAYLANTGTGNVLLLGNKGNDQLVGHHSGGETWIISGTGGANTINGKGGIGFIQRRGDHKDAIINASQYTKALN